jgi:hypothetical protein
MPAISLVVCVHRQRDFLERLIRESAGCYDELVVEHDLPDTQNVRSVVEAAGGRFFERPSANAQEPHWPFLWGQAKHDWILRLDADEFPGAELKQWLAAFRRAPEPSADLSGYTCIWPLWDGQRAVTRKWPAGRNFLFHKQRVRFLGMDEQTPVPDGAYEPLDLVLCHQPRRKAYGLGNILRGQSKRGINFIAQALLGKPTDLVCWRWESEAWPLQWEQIRRQPLWTAFKRLVKGPLFMMRDQWKHEKRIMPLVALSGPVHHTLICVEFSRRKRASLKPPVSPKLP